VLVQKAVWNDDVRREFAELLRTEKPDIVHVHNTWVMISPSIFAACREAEVPVVKTLHNYQLLCAAGTFFRDGKICEECMEHTLWRGVRHACYRHSRSETAAASLMLAVHRGRHTWDRDVTSYIVLTEFARKKFLLGGLPENKLFIKPNLCHQILCYGDVMDILTQLLMETTFYLPGDSHPRSGSVRCCSRGLAFAAAFLS